MSFLSENSVCMAGISPVPCVSDHLVSHWTKSLSIVQCFLLLLTLLLKDLSPLVRLMNTGKKRLVSTPSPTRII